MSAWTWCHFYIPVVKDTYITELAIKMFTKKIIIFNANVCNGCFLSKERLKKAATHRQAVRC